MTQDDDDSVELPEKQKDLDLNFHTDLPVGEILRRTRVHYGQTLQQIEVILRIRATQLDAIERGDISQLPGRVYAIGFVRSYSEYLGLDGDKMVHLFKEQSVGRQKKPDLSFPVTAAESRKPGKAIVIGSIVGIVALVTILSFFMFPSAPKTPVPPVPETLSQSQLNQAPALVGETGPVNAAAGQGTITSPAGQAPAAPASGAALQDAAVPLPENGTVPAVVAEAQRPANRMVIEIKDSSWIEIKNAKGGVLLRQVLKPGDMFLVPDEKGLVMATGNAGGLIIKIDGQQAEPLGTIGQIKRGIRLSPEAFGAPATLP